MTKVQLSELTEKDVENLMDNSTVWNKAIKEIGEQVSLELDGFLNALDGLSDYSVSDSSDRNNCLDVANPYKFLGSLEDACGYNVGILSDTLVDKANKLVKEYENTDCDDDEKWEQLENDVDKLANDYASVLLDTMVAGYDAIYDTEYVKEFMIDNLEYFYPENAYYNREDNSIYYMVKDQGDNKMSVGVGFLLIVSLVVWKVIDIVQWALSADWKAILKDFFSQYKCFM